MKRENRGNGNKTTRWKMRRDKGRRDDKGDTRRRKWRRCNGRHVVGNAQRADGRQGREMATGCERKRFVNVITSGPQTQAVGANATTS